MNENIKKFPGDMCFCLIYTTITANMPVLSRFHSTLLESLKLEHENKKKLPGYVYLWCPFYHYLTLFWAGSAITLLDGGGAIMARMDSSHPEAVCRHPKAQK